MGYLESAPLGAPLAPSTATYPRLMTGRHPRAVGTYGPAIEAWARERPTMHPRGLRSLRWWQQLALYRAFEHDDAGRLVWRTVLLSGPRQVGKSWLERVACSWRIHSGEHFGGPQDLLHVAHKLQAAQEVWRPAARWALAEYGRGCVRWANGEQQIELPEDGSRWLIQAATDGAGVAFTLSMALVDEAWRVSRQVVDAGIAPTMAEAEQPQLWLVSTAGTSASDLMRNYRALALALETPAEDGSLLMLEWSAPPDPDLDIDDPDVWRMASPHYDDRRALVLAQQRGQVSEVDFRQQWLNQWVPTASAPLFDSERWQASGWGGALPAGSLVFGADVAGDRSHAVIVAYSGGVVEVVESREGAAWVAGRLLELVEKWQPARYRARWVGAGGDGCRPARQQRRRRPVGSAHGAADSGGVGGDVRRHSRRHARGSGARRANRVGARRPPPGVRAGVGVRPAGRRRVGRSIAGGCRSHVGSGTRPRPNREIANMVNILNPLALAGTALDALARRVATFYATEGRDILHNSPDGWEIDRPAIWWMGNDGGAPPTWGNPPPGAEPSEWYSTLPAVSRCTSIIADTLAGLPWQVLRGYDALPTPDWITDPQAVRLDGRVVADSALDVEVRLSAVEFYTNWITAALWLGDGYVYVPVRDSAGQPKPPLWQLHPLDVQIKDGRYFVQEVELPAGSILHLRGEPPYRGGHGNGVITRHAEDLGLAIMTRNYTEGMYSSGVPAGYLKSSQPHLEESEAKDLKAKWLEQHGGSKRSIAVLNATTDFNPIQISPIDSALDTARQWSLRDTALAFGVPPYMLGVPGDSSTYANVESRMIELRAFTLLPWCRRIESTLDAQYPRGTTLKIKTAGLERADTKTRYDAYAVGISAGFLTPADVRDLEDMPPLDEPAPPPPPALPPAPPALPAPTPQEVPA